MSRHVVITGASRGIGAAIAQHFIDSGDTVVALSRSGAAPDGCAMSLAVDVASSPPVTAAVKSAIEAYGPVDVLVANAGITRDGLALRMGDEQWHDVIGTNLDGAFFSARAVLSSMIRARSGRIIFMGSVSPFYGVPGQSNYAAAKAGMVGLARSLAREVASRGITVNVIAPGFIDTDMTSDLGATSDAMTALIPMGRLGTTADIASAVGFLASDGAAYLTGQVIAIDGGLAMGL
jgi:NAD(P)-dependent dehydrogenase (short-subunit alcohol dehydrogenase family)